MKQKLLDILYRNRTVCCKICGSSIFEKWLETQGGQTGIYCSGCGRRISSGISVDYQKVS